MQQGRRVQEGGRCSGPAPGGVAPVAFRAAAERGAYVASRGSTAVAGPPTLWHATH